jgi:hypothetical protein
VESASGHGAATDTQEFHRLEDVLTETSLLITTLRNIAELLQVPLLSSSPLPFFVLLPFFWLVRRVPNGVGAACGVDGAPSSLRGMRGGWPGHPRVPLTLAGEDRAPCGCQPTQGVGGRRA